MKNIVQNIHNLEVWIDKRDQFRLSSPFNHVVIDDFFEPEHAEQLFLNFPNHNDEKAWDGIYDNALEVKKT